MDQNNLYFILFFYFACFSLKMEICSLLPEEHSIGHRQFIKNNLFVYEANTCNTDEIINVTVLTFFS